MRQWILLTIAALGCSPVRVDSGDAGGDASACPDAVGSGTLEVIDDFEDGDGAIRAQDQRSGGWFTFNDGTGTQTPAPGEPVVPGAGGDGSAVGLATTGNGFSDFGAAIGADFIDVGGAVCGYDASNYRGIAFSAVSLFAGAASVMRVNVTTPATTDVAFGGECVDGCADHFGADVTLSGQFQRFEFEWVDLDQVGFGSAAVFSERELLSVLFNLPGPAFDVVLDDVEFLR
jgi:hypothetical protein